MPKGKPLSTEDRERIYDLYTSGLRQAEIAELFGITATTVSKSVSTQRKLHAGKRVEKVAEIVIGGDKRNGRLVSLGKERFEGTCLVGGKMKKRTFTASNGRNAQQQWEKWCQTLRDEQEFMDMVERKEPEKPEVVCGYPLDPIEEIRQTKQDKPPTDEEVCETQAEIDVTPAPVPEIQVRPWKEVAEEREKRIAELEAYVAQLEDKERMLSVSDQVISDSEGEVPKLAHWFNSNGAFRVFWLDKPVYVLWARSDSPKLYGVYHSMEAALAEVDRLNDVAKFLGQESAFEVEEVAWRG